MVCLEMAKRRKRPLTSRPDGRAKSRAPLVSCARHYGFVLILIPLSHGVNSMLPAAILVGAILALYLWRRAQTRRLKRTFEAKNVELQLFLNERTESLRLLLADPELSSADLRLRADTIIAEMEARNSNGSLNAFLADTREYLASEIGKR